MLGLGRYVFFSRGSALLSEVRVVKALPARRQPKDGVLHLPSVECVASCISSSDRIKVMKHLILI